jgi:GntR family transcriptional regulator
VVGIGRKGELHLNIIFSTSSNLAIYEQIINQIKLSIMNKELKSGEALPSIRGLAKDLQISVITTKRAYEELEQEGLIYSISGKGFYVSEQNTDMLLEKKKAMLEQQIAELVKECRAVGLQAADMKDIIDMLYQEEDDR